MKLNEETRVIEPETEMEILKYEYLAKEFSALIYEMAVHYGRLGELGALKEKIWKELIALIADSREINKRRPISFNREKKEFFVGVGSENEKQRLSELMRKINTILADDDD